ncbi:hypothetical protein CK203_075951 [Vitis vinifera]|uniref:Retrovirus-related Pol polyprotein from transposon TNT 1-94 n=1 Tax=Vitis vinifera TaxID=29760 RepID=A0A438C1T8_VITVI|nr:hypothetical protein CK203_075951 [Vitis vinifera]
MTKHVDVRYHFIRETISSGTVKLEKISTTDNPIDMATKVLPVSNSSIAWIWSSLMRQLIFLHLYLRIIGIFESLCILVEQAMLLIRPHVFLVCDLQLPCSSSLQETFAEVIHPPTDSDK